MNLTQSILKKRPFIIAGPCSAETEEQVMLVAQQLAQTAKIDVLRAGIWKPRTRPDREAPGSRRGRLGCPCGRRRPVPSPRPRG